MLMIQRKLNSYYYKDKFGSGIIFKSDVTALINFS